MEDDRSPVDAITEHLHGLLERSGDHEGATSEEPADQRSVVQLVGMFRLPSPIVFEGSCAGVAVDTCLGDFDARITLPRLEPSIAGKDGSIRLWQVREPDIGVPEHVLSAMFEERPDPSTFQVPRWGEVEASPQGETLPQFLATDVLIEYEELPLGHVMIEDTPRGKNIIQDHFVMEFFAQVDTWFERIAGWISVMVDQPLDVAGRLKVSITEGENLVIVAREGTEYTNASHIEWSASTGRHVEPVSEAVWYRAIGLASEGAMPDVLHQLLAEARIALELEDFRLAVIQAATAVEVSLAQRVEHDVTSLGSELASALGSERRTLGTLVRTLGHVYTLPTGTQAFVELRNRAVHKNYTPSRDEAESGIRTARDIVRLTAPEDHRLWE